MNRLTLAFHARPWLWLIVAALGAALALAGYAAWGFPFAFFAGLAVYAVVFIFTDWCPSCAVWGLMARLKRAVMATGRGSRSAP